MINLSKENLNEIGECQFCFNSLIEVRPCSFYGDWVEIKCSNDLCISHSKYDNQSTIPSFNINNDDYIPSRIQKIVDSMECNLCSNELQVVRENVFHLKLCCSNDLCLLNYGSGMIFHEHFFKGSLQDNWRDHCLEVLNPSKTSKEVLAKNRKRDELILKIFLTSIYVVFQLGLFWFNFFIGYVVLGNVILIIAFIRKSLSEEECKE